MTAAERIREYVLKHPQAKNSEIAEALGVVENTVKATISKDVKAGRCVRLEDGSVDYAEFFQQMEKRKEAKEWSDDVRQELVDHLMRSLRGETDGAEIRKTSREINKILEDIRKAANEYFI